MQSVATAQGAGADQLARAWTRLLAHAVRSQDDRPVTIGLLPFIGGPFAPANIGGLLDMLVVHEYPATSQAPAAIALIRAFAASRKPLLLGETSMFGDDLATQGAFVAGDGAVPRRSVRLLRWTQPDNDSPHTIDDAVYQQRLEQFMSLRAADPRGLRNGAQLSAHHGARLAVARAADQSVETELEALPRPSTPSAGAWPPGCPAARPRART